MKKIKHFISTLLILNTPAALAVDVTWNGSVDSNWNMPGNWSTGLVPGTTAGDVVLLTDSNAPVVATVVETSNSSSLQLSQDASLEINSGLLLFDDLILSGGDVLHLAGDVQVNGDLNVISNPSNFRGAGGNLTVEGESYINRGVFSIEGDNQTFSTGDLTVGTNGTLLFDFDKQEMNTVQVANHFAITPGAKLEIDLRDYTMGGNELELITFSSVSGSFDAADITITGLGGGVVTLDEDSLNLTVIDDVADRSSTLWFTATGGVNGDELDLQVNTGRRIRNLTSPDLSYTLTADGNDKVYTGTWSGSDFDGDGFNDTVSFDLRVQGFAGSSFTYDSETDSASMTELGGTSSVNGDSNGWSVGEDNLDLDAGETLRFAIENLYVSTSGGVVKGFMGSTLAEPHGGNNHVLIIGEGEDLEVTASNFATDFGFALEDPLLITSGADSSVNVGRVTFKIQVSDLPDFLDTEVGDYSHYQTGPQHRTEYAEATNLRYPDWSWDTLPMSAGVHRNDAIPSDVAETYANTYPMISMGGRNLYGESYVEAGMSAVAAALKEHNPNVFTVTYKNAGLHHNRTEANENFDEAEWSIYSLDENGERVYDYIRAWLRYNHNHPQMREWWSDWCVARLADPNIDGIFIDKGEGGQDKLLNENGEIDSISNRVKSYVSIFERMPEGDMLTGNTLRPSRFGGSRELLHIFNGAYSEGWHNGFSDGLISMSDADARAYTIQLFREAQLKGIMINPNYYQLNSFPITGDEAIEMVANGQAEEVKSMIREIIQLPLAYHLIPLEANTSYFSHQIMNTGEYGDAEFLWNPKPYIDEFKNPLGAPLGPPVRDGYVFTRSFEHVDVWLDVETEESVLAWDWEDIDSDGLDDLWEFRNFGSETSADPSVDTDDDGFTNLEEYQAGTDPNDGADPGNDDEGNSVNAFTPDPSKVYYIDSPTHNLRIGADGESEDPFTTSTTTTGAQVEWVFVDKGNGYWHIQLAAGGVSPRLRTRNNGEADMETTNREGVWTYYNFTSGALGNTYFVTLPDHDSSQNRLQVDNRGTVSFVSETSSDTWESFRFTEVSEP